MTNTHHANGQSALDIIKGGVPPLPNAAPVTAKPVKLQSTLSYAERASASRPVPQPQVSAPPAPPSVPQVDRGRGTTTPTDAPLIWPSRKKDGQPVVTDQKNGWFLFLKWGLTFRYDESFRKTLLIESDGTHEYMSDKLSAQLDGMAHKNGLVCSEQFMRRCAHNMAAMDPFNSAQEWLKSQITWDNYSRVRRILIEQFGCEDNEYYEELAVYLFVSIIRRIRNPGCQCDYMVVLRGEEGLRKSSFFRILCPESRFTDDVKMSMESKELIEKTAGKFVVEIGEMSGQKRDVEHTKQFVTRRVDSARAAYGHENEEVSRGFILVGTTNEEHGLVSTTGNRRYYMAEVHKIADKDCLEENRDQIWAEAIELEKSYGILQLPERLFAEAKRLQEKHEARNEVYETIRAAIEGIEGGTVTREDANRLAGFDTPAAAARDPKNSSYIRKAFIDLGWKEVQLSASPGMKRKRYYRKIDTNGNHVNLSYTSVDNCLVPEGASIRSIGNGLQELVWNAPTPVPAQGSVIPMRPFPPKPSLFPPMTDVKK